MGHLFQKHLNLSPYYYVHLVRETDLPAYSDTGYSDSFLVHKWISLY